MKKYLILLSVVLTIISCKKDKSIESEKSLLLGKWYLNEQINYIDDAGKLTYQSTYYYGGDGVWIIFNEDGSGEIASYINNSKHPFTYIYKNGVETETNTEYTNKLFEIKIEESTLTRTSRVTENGVKYVMIETSTREPQK